MRETDAHSSSRSYFFVNLGCPKNLVDAERVAARLETYGWRRAPSLEESGLIVVTTCAFITMAVEESIEVILEIAAAKDPSQLLAVLGCLVSREGAELEPLLPEVDIFLGVKDMARLPESLAAGEYGPSRERGCGIAGRILFTPPHIAYIKIAEGCSNRCAYCLIPEIRGELRSRDACDVETEAEALASAGVRELVVIAQDTTAWSSDMPPGGRKTGVHDIYALLESMSNTAPPWMRLQYLHPARIDQGRLIDLAARGVILPYLDIPVQHASDPILDRMGRGYRLDDLRRIFAELRTSDVGFVLRTTVMVGFPGETDRDYRVLVDFLEEVSFDHVGIFEFSPERGTSAAGFDGIVPDEIKIGRRDALVELQMDISHERLGARVGRSETILVDGRLDESERPSPEIWGVGRFYGQSYEIDGVTYLSGREVPRGRFASGRVIEAEAYDLFAEIERDLG